MKVVEDPGLLPKGLPYPVVAIGVFDGVHRGHQAILSQAVARALQTGGTPMLLTFSPHPQKVIAPQNAPLLLQTSSQKREILEQMGIQWMIQVPFNRRLSLCTPQQFASEVLHRYGFREIHVGENFRFGHRRSGGVETLEAVGPALGFQVFGVRPVSFRGHRVSSTRVRRAVSEGRIGLARAYLSRPYQLRGTVVRGAGRGARIGFPTANLAPENELLPANGVYVTCLKRGDELLPSISNVGLRPTVVNSASASIVETFILDHDRDLYGQEIHVDFLGRVRAEQRFASLEELRAQIGHDCARARSFHERVARQAASEQVAP